MVVKSNFRKVCDLKFTEGLVFLGCGGKASEWVNGITEILRKDGIFPPKVGFKKVYKLITTGGRIDLVMVIPKCVDIGKLAPWRLRFGDCSWWSDYRRNYYSHHE